MNLATPAEWACLAGVLAWLLATAALVWHMARQPRVPRVSQAEETAAADWKQTTESTQEHKP